jgi:hypothetical protein
LGLNHTWTSGPTFPGLGWEIFYFFI